MEKLTETVICTGYKDFMDANIRAFDIMFRCLKVSQAKLDSFNMFGSKFKAEITFTVTGNVDEIRLFKAVFAGAVPR